jgi:hypothetical protein
MLLKDRLHDIHRYMEIIRVFDANYAVFFQPDSGAWISHVTLLTQLIRSLEVVAFSTDSPLL